jgi:hypothetical protein
VAALAAPLALALTGSPASASSSAATTTTTSTTTTSTTTTTAAPPAVPVDWCGGTLSLATPTIDDPNLTNYSFYCDGQVTAYTVMVERPGQPNTGIDDFDASPNVFSRANGSQITTEGFSCSGQIPGDSINCFAGTGSHADVWTNIEGQIDTSDPFCANLPPHAKPGTKPEPGATALLVVTDATGAEAGPFKLTMSPACKAVKPVPLKHKKDRKRA